MDNPFETLLREAWDKGYLKAKTTYDDDLHNRLEELLDKPNLPIVALIEGFLKTEKDGTLLVDGELSTRIAAWIQLSDKLMLEITYDPDCSPEFYVSIEPWKPTAIRKSILEDRQGWHIVSWNLDDYRPTTDDGNICKQKRRQRLRTNK